ncbi:hypothetical protein EZI45_20950 [Delftia tsuruhatensis]|uniref:hypothetical protein n=1 Tax=Delftia tsuruhatensis TaxID=180282 RepID=UPI001054CCA2|nr:hypothetical protein [Delftia tsuruhatensis]TDF24605.1 hypothetical protein EZI45_20950 [Delftia tsuruhatensis]
MTEEDQQPPAVAVEYLDRGWYWVEKEGWGDGKNTIAPAMYKAECDAWYSIEFSGISTRFLTVLEPVRRSPPAAEGYRLLRANVDIIRPDDEYLSDDTTTWEPVGRCIFVGMHHVHGFKPGRRRLG